MAGEKSLKDSAKDNPTAMGDPVSLKAEKSDNEPTEHDRPNKDARPSQQGSQRSNPAQGVKDLAPTEQDINEGGQNIKLQPSDKHNKSLKELAKNDINEAEKGNKSMIGDPVSLKAETSEKDPVKDDKGKEDGTGRSGATATKGRDSKL